MGWMHSPPDPTLLPASIPKEMVHPHAATPKPRIRSTPIGGARPDRLFYNHAPSCRKAESVFLSSFGRGSRRQVQHSWVSDAFYTIDIYTRLTIYRIVSPSIAMELQHCLHLFAFASLVVAKDIPNLPARAASTQDTVPASVITPGPVLHGDVFKRSIATCGYIRGNSGTHVSEKSISMPNEGNSIALNMS
jgi:hypothetical protein